eukprot:m.336693 g.336693  ORF g.336693 m.336693 type:complete len:210 (+) comp17932_c0_seq1:256-885(+)
MSWFGPPAPKLEDTVFNLKLSAKQMARQQKKAEKEEKAAKAKVKKAIEAKNFDIAKVHAETAIRKKTEGLNMLRLSSRLESVASKINSAIMMKQTTKQMAGVCKGLDRALGTNDLTKVMTVMDTFEEQVGQLDVMDATVNNAIGSAMGNMTPVTEVDALIEEVANENALDVSDMLAKNSVATHEATPVEAERTKEEDSVLSQRLAALRG